MMEFIVTGATVKTAVVALRKARDAEESITARIRIQGALAELTNPIAHKSRPDNEPPRPLPSQDYTEYLIDQDGNEYPIDQDGNAQQINITIVQAGDRKQLVEFTNVPMDRVHAAIAVLNGDTDFGTLERGNITAAKADEFSRYDSEVRRWDHIPEGTKEFTAAELFKPAILRQSGYACSECGAMVAALDTHVTWHNKTLP